MAEWVAGSAIKLGFFPIFGASQSARAKNQKKCFKQIGGIAARNLTGISAKFSAKRPTKKNKNI